MQSAIKVATGKLGLQPGAAFQARVTQLAELVKAHKMVSFIKRADINVFSLSLWTWNASSIPKLNFKRIIVTSGSLGVYYWSEWMWQD